MKNIAVNRGFTLIELVLAIAISGIVMMGISSMMSALWKRSFDFTKQELTMDDVRLASEMFMDKVRTCSTASTASSGSINYIDFITPEGTSRIFITDDKSKLVYDPDTSDDGVTMDLLEGAVIDFSASNIGSTTLYTMNIAVEEEEVHKTNTFTFTAMARNPS